MGGLSLVSLNIERSKHLHRILPFFEARRPDVFCVQELLERDVALISQLFKYKSDHVPLSMFQGSTDEGVPQGIGIFSNYPLFDIRVAYYAGDASQLPATIELDPATYKSGNRAVLLVSVDKDGKRYRIATTHFTWSEKGRATDLQREHLSRLIRLLESEKELILCGDFNLPRGGELFGELERNYKDNIPSHYKTSVDLTLHRNRHDDSAELMNKMVDGLFTTVGYVARDVQLVPGLSDHMAIVASVEKS